MVLYETYAIFGTDLRRLWFILLVPRIRTGPPPFAIQVHHPDKIRISHIGVMRIPASEGVLDADTHATIFLLAMRTPLGV
jgi:hypothetical protein